MTAARRWSDVTDIIRPIRREAGIIFPCLCSDDGMPVMVYDDDTEYRCNTCGRWYRLRLTVEVAAPGLPEGGEDA